MNIMTLLGNWKNCGTWKWRLQIIIGALDTVTEGLMKGSKDLDIRGRVETIQTTTLLRSAKILKRILDTWEDSKSSERLDKYNGQTKNEKESTHKT